MKDNIKRILTLLCAVSVMAISSAAYAATQAPTSKTTTTTTTTTTATRSKTSTDDEDTSSSTAVSGTTVTGKAVSGSESVSGDEDYSDSSSYDEDTSYDDTTSEDTSDTSAEDETADSGIDKPVPTAISVDTTQDQTTGIADATEQKANERRYTTKGGAFLWFLLSVLVNIVISFLIGNRFYNLAKKERNVGPEIKALRRDLEEKFTSNVGGFSEMETDVINTNDNYSANGSISMPERSSIDFSEESQDVFKRWDSKMNRKRQPQRAEISEPENAEEEDFEEEVKKQPAKRKYQPTRKAPAVDEPEEDDDVKVRTKVKKAGNKAKSFLGDIFPFKDNDDDVEDIEEYDD